MKLSFPLFEACESLLPSSDFTEGLPSPRGILIVS